VQQSPFGRVRHQKFLLKLVPFDPSLVGSTLSFEVVEHARCGGTIYVGR